MDDLLEIGDLVLQLGLFFLESRGFNPDLQFSNIISNYLQFSQLLGQMSDDEPSDGRRAFGRSFDVDLTCDAATPGAT